MPADPDADHDQARSAAKVDLAGSLRNAMIVGLSLVTTWSVALGFRLWLPRHLGPVAFGLYAYVEAMAVNGVGFLGLGIDSYIQKEIPTRPDHASDFFGGTLTLRLLGSLVVFAILAGLSRRFDSADLTAATLLFAGGQFAGLMGTTAATLLYSARKVGRLSILNILSKLVWGGGLLIAILGGGHLWALALATLVSESFRTLVLLWITRTSLALRVRWDWPATFAVVKKSLPYYVNAIAMALYAKIDVAIMSGLVPEVELGYYGAATNASAVAMMMAPLFNWVLMPQLSIAAATDRARFLELVRRTFDWTVLFGAAIAIVLGTTGDAIVLSVFGPKFGASVTAFRALAPTFLFVYLAMLGSTALILLGRSWTATWIMIGSLGLNALLNVLLVRAALAWFGVGGAGIGAGSITSFCELVVAVAMFAAVGKGAIDGTNVKNLLRLTVTCAAVVLVDHFAKPLGLGRVILAGCIFLLVAIATRALRIREAISLVKSARKR
jgi:O-antigen/teichoic acid export membrane protein